MSIEKPSLKTKAIHFVCWLSFHRWDKRNKIKQPCKNCNLVRVHVNGFNKWTRGWCYVKNDL